MPVYTLNSQKNACTEKTTTYRQYIHWGAWNRLPVEMENYCTMYETIKQVLSDTYLSPVQNLDAIIIWQACCHKLCARITPKTHHLTTPGTLLTYTVIQRHKNVPLGIPTELCSHQNIQTWSLHELYIVPEMKRPLVHPRRAHRCSKTYIQPLQIQ